MARIWHILALMVALVWAPAAHAQFNILPEIRGGVFAAGVDQSSNLLDPELISHGNGELLFSVPDLNAWTPIGELRPHIGATFSLKGGDSYGYAGLSYTFQAPVLPVFAEVSFGGVAHTSMFSAPEGDPSRAIGCGVGLRAAASVGVNLPLGASIIGTVEHLPDFGTCQDDTRGAINVGLRLGWRF
jgi:lipid A 3-O-deacylase